MRKQEKDQQPKTRNFVAIAAKMRNSAGSMGGGKKRKAKQERAKARKELRDGSGTMD
jgi:hypothetical protein